MLFKIRCLQKDTTYSATYLGEEQRHTFGRQNSGSKADNFVLYGGTQIDVEFDATRITP